MEVMQHLECPKISVVIPIYNMEQLLPRCLDSLQAQTFTDFEVICVDDGSKDGSLKLLNAYAAKDPRIRVISQKNGGVSAARNRGFDEARGEYLYCLDPDDLIHPKCLEIAYAAIMLKRADFVCFTWKKFSEAYSFSEESTEEMAEIYTETPFQTWHALPLNQWGCMPSVWRFLFQKSSIGKLRFETWITEGEDQLFILLYLLHARKGVFIKNTLYYYYQRPGSLSRAPMIGVRLNYTYFILKEVFNHCLTDADRHVVQKELVPWMVKSFNKRLKFGLCHKKINAVEFQVGLTEWQRCVSMLLQEKILCLRYFSLRWQWRLVKAVICHRFSGKTCELEKNN